MHHPLTLSSLALALFVAVPVAHAVDATATFEVSATVNPRCLVSADPLAFGTGYVPGSGDATATSAIRVNCTKTTPFTVKLNAGAAADFASRAMSWGGESLTYQLYTDSNHTTVWGDGTTGGTGAVQGAGLGMGTAQAVPATVYGRILDAANVNVAAGTYTDTVTVTVSY